MRNAAFKSNQTRQLILLRIFLILSICARAHIPTDIDDKYYDRDEYRNDFGFPMYFAIDFLIERNHIFTKYT